MRRQKKNKNANKLSIRLFSTSIIINPLGQKRQSTPFFCVQRARNNNLYLAWKA